MTKEDRLREKEVRRDVEALLKLQIRERIGEMRARTLNDEGLIHLAGVMETGDAVCMITDRGYEYLEDYQEDLL